MTSKPDRWPAFRANRGDLVVAKLAASGPAHIPTYEVGVVSHTDDNGWVTAFDTAQGATRPVAFIPERERASLLLVPRDRIDVPAALSAAKAHGPFASLAEIRNATRPLLHPAHNAEMEAGS